MGGNFDDECPAILSSNGSYLTMTLLLEQESGGNTLALEFGSALAKKSSRGSLILVSISTAVRIRAYGLILVFLFVKTFESCSSECEAG